MKTGPFGMNGVLAAVELVSTEEMSSERGLALNALSMLPRSRPYLRLIG